MNNKTKTSRSIPLHSPQIHACAGDGIQVDFDLAVETALSIVNDMADMQAPTSFGDFTITVHNAYKSFTDAHFLYDVAQQEFSEGLTSPSLEPVLLIQRAHRCQRHGECVEGSVLSQTIKSTHYPSKLDRYSSAGKIAMLSFPWVAVMPQGYNCPGWEKVVSDSVKLASHVRGDEDPRNRPPTSTKHLSSQS